MKFVIYTDHTQHTGSGHFVRMSALAHYLRCAGHRVSFMCSTDGLYGDKGVPHKTGAALELGYHPDWLVYDMPGGTPDWVTQGPWNACIIDGVGQPPTGTGHIVVQQDVTSPYLILRPEIAAMTSGRWDKHKAVFVFGGRADSMGLVGRIKKAAQLHQRYPDYVFHYVTVGNFDLPYIKGLPYFERAVVAMGMIVWELAAVGVKPIVFSYTKRHLESAKRMDENGYCTHYPGTGLPVFDDELVDFITSVKPQRPAPVDPYGAIKLVSLMEGKKYWFNNKEVEK